MAKLIYCGHSTVIIESDRGKRIMIDPFLEGNPRCPAALQDPGKIDFICLTHGHSDHTSSAPELAKKYQSTVFATWELGNLMVNEGISADKIQFMNKGGRVEVDGIGISLTQAFHSSSYDASDGVTYYAGEAAGIVVELESGKAIYHAGDTLLFRDMELIGERYSPEVALLPIGDRFTMGPQDAAQAVEFIQPNIVIPIHYATFPPLSGRPEEFAELLHGGKTKVQVLEPGGSLTV